MSAGSSQPWMLMLDGWANDPVPADLAALKEAASGHLLLANTSYIMATARVADSAGAIGGLSPVRASRRAL